MYCPPRSTLCNPTGKGVWMCCIKNNMTRADQLKRKPGLAGVHGNLTPRQKVLMKKNNSKDATHPPPFTGLRKEQVPQGEDGATQDAAWMEEARGRRTHMSSREEARYSRQAKVRKRQEVQRVNEETVTLGVIGNLCMQI